MRHARASGIYCHYITAPQPGNATVGKARVATTITKSHDKIALADVQSVICRCLVVYNLASPKPNSFATSERQILSSCTSQAAIPPFRCDARAAVNTFPCAQSMMFEIPFHPRFCVGRRRVRSELRLRPVLRIQPD